MPLLCALAGLLHTPDDPPTFTRDVAPIVFERCAPCHHPGEAAPFALLDHADLKRRAPQIVQVTAERYMPPWLPADDGNHFAGDRSLSDEQIETLRAWVEAGCPEGDPADLPPAPVFSAGWDLGEPDLVVSMPEAYTVPAEGRDVYRNFVIPRPLDRQRYVRALEFRPDNRAVLHHAVLFVDGSGYARGEDRRDPDPGYAAMGLGVLRPPNGQFVSWTPGKGAIAYEHGIAWSLDETLDIVLQLHLRPTGRPEPIRVAVGLYFSDEPPSEHPLAIRLWTRDIDIPAGEAAHVIEESYVLPVPVSVYGIYPHCHYLGKDIQGWAELPDGTRRSLIHIPSWDFNWQEEYFYAEPIPLPAGSVVHARYVFDNSEANPFNPNQPPVRVVHGYQSSDEMAELQLQVLTSEWDRPLLWHDFVQLSYRVDQANVERGLESMPGNRPLREEAFKYCLRRGDAEGALAHARAMVELSNGAPEALVRVGQAQVAGRDFAGAVETLEGVVEALMKRPGPATGKALLQLGRAHQGLGHDARARALFQSILERDPGNFLGNTAMGELEVRAGELEQAERSFARALATNPEHLLALWNLARLDCLAGRLEQAEARCQKVLEIAADEAGGHFVLGLVAERRERFEDARRRFELAVRFEPEEPEFVAALARARARSEEPAR